ncbi:magnesium and cobalt transport protein CorA [Streptacidiphilus monticola]|uniref:Magnesium and cobalt transport protein CorA n=1 Tax=Streptacidiphilus monticola TaxID=2161674 RepID=A0ABW1FVH0_9ACTN
MTLMGELRRIVRSARTRTLPAVTATEHGRGGVVDSAVYRKGRRVETREDPLDLPRRLRGEPGNFVWIGLFEPTAEELAGLAERFGLHPLAVEDAVHAHQRPKVERYDDVLFTVFKTIGYVEHDEVTASAELIQTGELMVFTGPHFVITVRHGRHGGLHALRRRLEDQAARGEGLLQYGPSGVLHAIADQVVDDYLDVTDALGVDVDEVEASVFSGRGGRGVDAGRIYQLKRETLEFKHACWPLLRPLQRLAENEDELVAPQVAQYLRDVADHLTRVNERVGAYDELINSILQAHLAQVSVAQNEDMRKITAWAAIFAVPTVATGVWGMNFQDMPELHWAYGYPVAMAGVVAVCVAIYVLFRRSGWL